MLDIQLIQAKRDYETAVAKIAATEGQFQRVMRAHARAFAQLGLANNCLAEYQELVVNAEFTVAGGARIRHPPRRLEEIPRAVTAETTTPQPRETAPQAVAREEPFLRRYRGWILGGIGAFFLFAVGYFVAKK